MAIEPWIQFFHVWAFRLLANFSKRMGDWISCWIRISFRGMTNRLRQSSPTRLLRPGLGQWIAFAGGFEGEGALKVGGGQPIVQHDFGCIRPG
jgi:hypothetical protein